MPKSYSRKVNAEEQERIFEELSQQVVRKDKLRVDLGIAMGDLNSKIKKISKKHNVPKPTLNELVIEDRSRINAIFALLDEFRFLSREADSEYLLDCWLDIKSKYLRLSGDARKIIAPKIKEAVKPFGNKFRI